MECTCIYLLFKAVVLIFYVLWLEGANSVYGVVGTLNYVFVKSSLALCQHQGPVVQSIVSLTSSLSGQLIKCFTTL